jgi:hypothetical protein
MPLYVLALWVVRKSKAWVKRGTRKMHKKIYLRVQEQARQQICEIVTDIVDERFLAGEITARERHKLWAKFARTYGLWDLIPKDVKAPTPDASELKAAILARLPESVKARLSTNRKVVDNDANMQELLA